MRSLSVRVFTKKFIGLPILLLTLILVFSCSERDSQNLTFAQLSAGEQETIVNRVDSLLIDRYVFPDLGKEGGAFIKSQLASGASVDGSAIPSRRRRGQLRRNRLPSRPDRHDPG